MLALIATATAAAIPLATAAGPAIEWEKLYGAGGGDEGSSVLQTADGGYILFGTSGMDESRDGWRRRGNDIWLVKLDAAGQTQWDRLLGGQQDEDAVSMQQTADGGYILLGTSRSSEEFDVTDMTNGGTDYWVVKLDAAGQIQWNRLLGGSDREVASSIDQTADGGYVIVGTSRSSANGDVTGTNHGEEDVWVVKLNGAGQTQWDRLLGGDSYEQVSSVQRTADGGCVILGSSFSSANGDVTEPTPGEWGGSYDFWVVKLNAAGQIQWNRLIGGNSNDLGRSIRLTSEGGYILLGYSGSSASGDVKGELHKGRYNSGDDFWVVKLDAGGEIQWEHLLGGIMEDRGYSVQQTADGGYVLLGYSTSGAENGGVTGPNHGTPEDTWGEKEYPADFWLVKLDAAGTYQWDRLLGGDGEDEGASVQQTADEGYVLLGTSTSSASGDVTGTNHDNPSDYVQHSSDFWLVKLAGSGPSPSPTTTSPTPSPTVSPVQIPGGSQAPKDTNGDGKYDDVNGNARKDFADVVLYFNQMSWITANEPVGLFDYNGNGRIDFADVVWLFNHL